jgi:hypothetical protein
MSLVLPLAAGAALLLLLGGGSAAKPKPKPKADAAPKARAIPQGMAMSAPKSAPKTAQRGTVTLGPVRVIKRTATKVAPPSGMSAPLSKAPSQGGGPGLAAPLSADIPTDTLSPAAQRPATTPRSQPGYDPSVARRAASSIANHLRRAGKAKYDHRMLKQWQTQAGLDSAPMLLKADGLYGPATRGALIFYGVKDPPTPFLGSGSLPFKPPV